MLEYAKKIRNIQFGKLNFFVFYQLNRKSMANGSGVRVPDCFSATVMRERATRRETSYGSNVFTSGMEEAFKAKVTEGKDLLLERQRICGGAQS